MNARDLKQRIDTLRAEVQPAMAMIASLERELRDVESREWILLNGVTDENLQRCDDAAMPYFMHVREFAAWLNKHNCRKRWCTWNDMIYSTDEIRAGRMAREAIGRIEHVQHALPPP